ncbi:MAG: hypothetical protein RRY42_07015, partial [Mucinivorans sp.]
SRSSATLQKFLTLDDLNAAFCITLISHYLGLRAPTPRSVPRHGDFLLVTAIPVSRERPIKRRHASPNAKQHQKSQ